MAKGELVQTPESFATSSSLHDGADPNSCCSRLTLDQMRALFAEDEACELIADGAGPIVHGLKAELSMSWSRRIHDVVGGCSGGRLYENLVCQL